MIALWVLALVVALAVTLGASRAAVGEATHLARRWRVPPFVIGLTLVAIGTDLPEIANSIIASAAGHGDLNVGDSVGSAVAQVTLTLGLLPFLAGAFPVGRRQAIVAGLLTAAALAGGAALVLDGRLGHVDGLVLITAWIAASLLVWRLSPRPEVDTTPVVEPLGSPGRALLYLGGVGLGASGMVIAILQISQALGVPEYFVSFFGAAVGTSLPELIFDLQALRRRASELAVGDLFGSSLVDATLSLGIGPLLFAAPVSADLALRGGLTAAVALLAVTLLFSRVRLHDWRSGLLLLLLYAAFYPILLR